jgi:hypothetical protein
MSADPKDERTSKLDALLAQGRLGGPAKERILAAVLDAQPKPARRWQRTIIWVGSLSTAAVAVVLLALSRPPSGFRARGAAGAAPLVEVGCAGGDTTCAAGATLVFRVAGALEGGFLQAYAEPMAAGGERVWYFPSGGAPSPFVPAGPAPQTLAEGVRVGAEQPPGRYRVHLVLSRRPLDRAETLAPPSDAVWAERDVTLEIAR